MLHCIIHITRVSTHKTINNNAKDHQISNKRKVLIFWIYPYTYTFIQKWYASANTHLTFRVSMNCGYLGGKARQWLTPSSLNIILFFTGYRRSLLCWRYHRSLCMGNNIWINQWCKPPSNSKNEIHFRWQCLGYTNSWQPWVATHKPVSFISYLFTFCTSTIAISSQRQFLKKLA